MRHTFAHALVFQWTMPCALRGDTIREVERLFAQLWWWFSDACQGGDYGYQVWRLYLSFPSRITRMQHGAMPRQLPCRQLVFVYRVPRYVRWRLPPPLAFRGHGCGAQRQGMPSPRGCASVQHCSVPHRLRHVRILGLERLLQELRRWDPTAHAQYCRAHGRWRQGVLGHRGKPRVQHASLCS